MLYNIHEIFGKLPATATSFEEAVKYKDKMIILEVDKDEKSSGKASSKVCHLINMIVDVLNEGDKHLPLLLKCDVGYPLPKEDIVHRTLNDGSIYSSYYKKIDSETSLKSIIAKNLGKLSIDGNVLCFPDFLVGFTLSYVYFVIFDEDMLKQARKTAVDYKYVNIGRNNFGIQTLGFNKFDIPSLNPCTPVLDNEFSYLKRLDKTTRKILDLFSPVDYVLCSYNNHLLDEGYFIRINSETNSIKDTIFDLLQFLSEDNQRMRMIYHGVLADSMKDNKLLLSGKLHQDSDVNLQLQSFLSDDVKVEDFLRNGFNRILLDDAIFFNKDIIFTFYDLGADFRFFNKKDYEKFFKLCNRNHLITMASYIPEGESLSIIDNISRVNA